MRSSCNIQGQSCVCDFANRTDADPTTVGIRKTKDYCGVVDTRNLVFYGTVIALFLHVAVFGLERRRLS